MADKTTEASGELHQVTRTWSPYDRIAPWLRARLRQMWNGFGLNPETASRLRYEVDMLLLRARCAVSPKFRRQVRDLRSHRHLLVHLGCGNALLPGWINVDCYPPAEKPGVEILALDMRRGLPFATESVAALFTEHFLEHLPHDTVREVVIPEIRRVLEPGGHVRIGVPNGEYYVDQYVAYRSGQTDALFELHCRGATPMKMLNDVAHGYGHRFLYDFQSMHDLLQAVGFTNIARSGAGASDVAHFHGKDRADAWRRAMTLYVEAQAPS